MRRVFIYLIDLYQKSISSWTKSSCRYYPSCSEYAKWQFEANSFYKALFFTIKRILSCNQLFKGGFDYPIVKKSLKKNTLCQHNKDKKLFFVKFYLIPKDGDRYYLIKRFKRN
jgi:putative membrane protein insertion efficiency factor